LRVDTHLVKVVDTAGIRDASDEIEKIGIDRSRASADESEIILAVFDISSEFDSEDKEILSIIKSYHDSKEIVVILNKADKKIELDTKIFEEFDTIEFSKEHSIEVIIEKLQSILDKTSIDDDMMLTSKRQVGHVEDAYNYIEEAVENLDMAELELFAYNINDAITSISSITKSFERDEILDKMFGSFCLGK
jgi:tRNA modification GTPase